MNDNYDEEEYENEELYEDEEEYDSGSYYTRPPKTGNPIRDAVNGVKGIGKLGFKNLAGAFMAGMKSIFIAIFSNPIVLAVVIFIIIMAIFWFAIADQTTKKVTNSVKDYIVNTDSISELAKDLYTERHSLLLLKLSEINAIYDAFIQDKANPGDIKTAMKTVVGTIDVEGKKVSANTSKEDPDKLGFGWPVNLAKNEGARVITYIFPETKAYGKKHGGIDIAAGEGENKILAAKEGVIYKIAKEESGSKIYGNSVVIQHDGGYYTRYSHLASISDDFILGDEIGKGEYIGMMGSSGEAETVHLGFEFYYGGIGESQRIDPLNFYETDPEYGSIKPENITTTPSGYKFKSEKGGSHEKLEKFIRFHENAKGAPTNADGTKYIIITDYKGNPTVGYGIDIFNGGFYDTFVAAGYPTYVGGEVPVEFVDNLERELCRNRLKSYQEKLSGLGLKDYQINALVARSYQLGESGGIGTHFSSISFIQAYQKYWDANIDDMYGSTQPDFTRPLYTNYMSKPAEPVSRRKREWVLFQTGIYDFGEIVP